MSNMDKRTRKLVAAAIVGAAYAALTIVLGDFGYGPIQLRISEVFCVLPFFFPPSVWGLFVGCALANLVGGYGLPDIVFGSLATLLAGLCAAQFGKGARGWVGCILTCAMPVVFNAPIIGAVLSYTIAVPFWTGFVQVGAGEAIVMFAVGLPLMRILMKNERMTAILKSF